MFAAAKASLPSPALQKARTDEHLEAFTGRTSLRLDAENMKYHNSLQVISAERFVYSSHDDFDMVREMLASHPHLKRANSCAGKFGNCCGRMNSMKVQVECYAGRKADERPVRFRLESREYMVEEVLDQWYGPENIFFKIRADDGCLYILRHETSVPDGDWELVSFREPGRGADLPFGGVSIGRGEPGFWGRP
jgi:hypothetical protein